MVGRTLLLVGLLSIALPAHADDQTLEERVGARSFDVLSTDPQLDRFSDVVLVGTNESFRCSGIIVDSTHVLTAAHCLPAQRIGLGDGLDVALDVAVERSERHPTADIAVLTLSRKLDVTTHARRGSDATPPLGAIRIVGFGVKDQLNLTGFGDKRQIDVSIDGWGCDRRRSFELGCQVGIEMLLRGGKGIDTCFGDSGGPVFEATEDGWRLLAIVSRGTRPKRLLCGEGGIYTRVDVLDAWIRKRTGR